MTKGTICHEKKIAINLYAPSIGTLSLFKTNITRHIKESETALVAQRLPSGGLSGHYILK